MKLLAIGLLFFATNISSEEISYDFKEFNEKLSLTRGTVSPAYTESYYLENDEACRFAITYWGWEDYMCTAIDSFLVNTSPDIDTLVIEVANSDGYVNQEDSVEALDELLEDVETVLEENSRLLYYDRNGLEQHTHQITVISIDTDEGVLDPLGVGEVLIEVRY